MAGINFPPDARLKSHISEDNYLVRFLHKYYLEDFHTTTLVYLLSFTADSGDRPFLRLFFELLTARRPELSELDGTLAGFRVYQEARSDGWIDILLINRTIGKAIIVENKIYARDQDRQLPKYYDEIRRRRYRSNENFRVPAVVYLSLDGHMPSFDGWNENDRAILPLICMAYDDESETSIRKGLLEKSLNIPECERVQLLVKWYGEIIEDLSGRNKVMEIMKDFAGSLIDDHKAMTTIADILQSKDDIEAALCQELGDRVLSAIKNQNSWTIENSKDQGSHVIWIENINKRWNYVLWFEEKFFSHGFEAKGDYFTSSEITRLKKILGEKAEEPYLNTLFKTHVTFDLSNKKLTELFTEAGIMQIVEEIKKIIDSQSF